MRNEEVKMWKYEDVEINSRETGRRKVGKTGRKYKSGVKSWESIVGSREEYKMIRLLTDIELGTIFDFLFFTFCFF